MALRAGVGDGGTKKRSSSGGSFASNRSGGNGTGVQKMGGSDYNFIAAVPKGGATKPQTASSILQAGVAGQGSGTSSAAAYTGPTAEQKAAAAEAARKASIRGQYGEAQAQNATVYDAASGQIKQQVNGINSGYNRGIQLIARDANNRVRQDKSINKARTMNQAQAAKAMGLSFVPTGGRAAADSQDANRSAMLRQALAWRGLLTAQHQTALQRNDAQATTFQAGKVSQSAAIENLMLKALGLA